MIYVVGVDPGKTGAFTLLSESGVMAVHDFNGWRHAHNVLSQWLAFYSPHVVALEDVGIIRRVNRDGSSSGDSMRSAKTFMQHVGGWKCLLDVMRADVVDVLPRTWMKGRIRTKRGKSDKPSVETVERKYPYVNLRGPRGGVRDGRADSILIAEWALEEVLKNG